MATTATLVETVTSVSPAEVNTTVPRKSLGTTLPGEIEMVDVVTVPLLGVDTKVAVDRMVDPVDPLPGLNLRTAWESSGCL